MRRIATVAIFAASWIVSAPATFAQAPAQPPPATATLDPARELTQIEAALGHAGVSKQTLGELRDRLAPLRESLRGRLEALEAALEEVKTRLKDLGAPPAAGAPPEPPDLAAERQQLTQRQGELESAVRQARLLASRADRLSVQVAERRRAALTREYLQRTSSVLSPFLWIEAAAGLPPVARDFSAVLLSWWTFAKQNGGLAGWIGAVLTLCTVGAIVIMVAGWWRRRVRGPAVDTRFGKARAALGGFIRAAFAMPLAVTIAVAVAVEFELLPAGAWDYGDILVFSIAVATFGRGAAIALFAPGEARRRIIALGEDAARRLAGGVIWAARLNGIGIFIGGTAKLLGAAPALTAAISALASALIIAIFLRTLLREGATETRTDAEAGAIAQWLRIPGWILVAVAAVALLAGYIGVASFVAGQTVIGLTVLCALYPTLVFVDSLLTEKLTSDTPRGRAAASTLGLQRRGVELIGVVLSAAVRVLLIMLAAFVLATPWGVSAGDFLDTIRNLSFGFQVGEFSISLSAILLAIAVLMGGFLLTRAAQRWLESQVFPRTALDPGLRLSLATVFGYVGVIIAISAALAALGIDLQKIALVAGALSVGIGFGLQSIVSNFVSGLILLAERPIQVGDSISVRGEEGYVRRISVRATEIETADRAILIVPNSELVSGAVKNWTHNDTTGRVVLKVNVARSRNPDQVRDLLVACATEHPQVLKTPPPSALMVSFGEVAIEFELRCVVADVDRASAVKSDLYFSILQALSKSGDAGSQGQRPPAASA